MGKINKLFILAAILFTFISCSKDEGNNKTIFNKDIRKKTVQVISPNGFFVAENIGQLQEELFKNDPNIMIESVVFFDIKNSNGAAALIKYADKGLKKTIGFVIGDVLAQYDNTKDLLITSRVNLLKSSYISYSCSGTTCCTATEHINYETKVVSFFCKCDGNSGCSMTVESSTGKQPNTLQPMPK